MSLKKIEQVKASKWFKIWDLLVYGLLAGTIVALILVFTLGGKGKTLQGFNISYKGEQVFSYSFSDGTYEILNGDCIKVEEEDDDGLLLAFYTQGGAGFNKIAVDKKAKSVKITASNCSTHKDCVYTPALSGSRSVPILCTPHALSVSPFTALDDGVIKT